MGTGGGKGGSATLGGRGVLRPTSPLGIRGSTQWTALSRKPQTFQGETKLLSLVLTCTLYESPRSSARRLASGSGTFSGESQRKP